MVTHGRPAFYLCPSRQDTVTEGPRQVQLIFWFLERAIELMRSGRRVPPASLIFATEALRSRTARFTARSHPRSTKLTRLKTPPPLTKSSISSRHTTPNASESAQDLGSSTRFTSSPTRRARRSSCIHTRLIGPRSSPCQRCGGRTWRVCGVSLPSYSACSFSNRSRGGAALGWYPRVAPPEASGWEKTWRWKRTTYVRRCSIDQRRHSALSICTNAITRVWWCSLSGMQTDLMTVLVFIT